jgi:hypothetical protein
MKEQMVLVISYDHDMKPHYFVCEDMETAKRLYPYAEKRSVTIKK